MPFHPTLKTTLQIQGTTFRFVEHPGAPGLPYGQTGRRAKVFCIQNEMGQFLALKMFFHEFRSPQVERSAYNLGHFAQIPGLSVCARTVLTPASDDAIIQQNPDLMYAVLMPWVVGKTWYEVIFERMSLSPSQSFSFADGLAKILVALEQHSAAHGDISSGNVMLPGLLGKHPLVALVDVEEIFAPGFEQPAKLPAGTPGYNHKTASAGLWGPESDRFAGAILLAELLCWCDPAIRQAAVGGIANPGEQYFDPKEIQLPCQRYDMLYQSLQKNWGAAPAEMLRCAWQSSTLSECPTFEEWQSAIRPLEMRAAQLSETLVAPVDVSSPVKRWRIVGQPAQAQSVSPVENLAFLPAGFLLNGRYEIQEQLGEGGFGTVYLAIDRQTHGRCVVKVNRENTPAGTQQFAAEARILRSLQHPGLPKVYDYLEIPEQGQYIVMEFIAGDNLNVLIKRAMRPMPLEQSLNWISQVCDTLDYLHSQTPPVIHRDIKPANIIIGADGLPKLVDFGVAKTTLQNAGTMTGARAHTPGFSPPEQYGTAPTDARSDVYAIGATLYALLTGRVPPESVILVSGKSLPQIRQFNSDVNPQIESAVYRAMSLDANQRFRSAAEFKAALFSSPVYPAPPPEPVYPVPLSSSPNWLAIGLGVGLAGLLCAVVAAVLAFQFWFKPSASTPMPTDTLLPSAMHATELPVASTEIESPTDVPITDVPPTEKPSANPFTGQRIAYALGSSQSSNRSIYIKYLDGTRSDEKITTGTDKFGDNYPTFSPDGKSLAFTRCYIQKSDGCELFVKSLAEGNPQVVLIGHKVMRPKWCGSNSSPYRDWIVFEDRRKNGNEFQDTTASLGLVNTATGEFKKLTDSVSDWHPNWSPDCSQIIFTRYDDNDKVGLYADLMLLDLNSSSVTPLVGSGGFNPPAELSGAWSPDGQWIAYREAADRNGDGNYRAADDRNDLWLIPSNGGSARTIIANSYSIASIAWSPDSQNILFSTQDNHMLVCDLDGQVVFDFGGDYFHPAWSP